MEKTYGTHVKWIAAQSIDGGDWIVRGLYIDCDNTGLWDNRVPSIEDSNMFDTTPIGDMRRSVFAIFRNREGWQDHNPRRLMDCRDKRDWPIMGCGALINAVNSDFTINR